MKAQTKKYDYKQVSIVMKDEKMYDAVKEAAESECRNVAGYIRSLIITDLKMKGLLVK